MARQRRSTKSMRAKLRSYFKGFFVFGLFLITAQVAARLLYRMGLEASPSAVTVNGVKVIEEELSFWSISFDRLDAGWVSVFRLSILSLSIAVIVFAVIFFIVRPIKGLAYEDDRECRDKLCRCVMHEGLAFDINNLRWYDPTDPKNRELVVLTALGIPVSSTLNQHL